MTPERRVYETQIRKIADQLGKTETEAYRLVHSGEWRVWSASVGLIKEPNVHWMWTFKYDFEQNYPLVASFDQVHETDGDSTGSNVWIRVAEDDELCNTISERAMQIGAPGYQLVYRAKLRNGQFCWIEENVLLQPMGEDSWYVVGVCTPAIAPDKPGGHVIGDMDAVQLMNLIGGDSDTEHFDEPDDVDVRQLQREVKRLKEDMDLLVRSGQWLIWSADVTKSPNSNVVWHWKFTRDYNVNFPEWFDIDRSNDTDLSQTLDRVRLVDDNARCHSNTSQALALGLPGYSQNYRVRLRDGRISWVEENVSILQRSATKFRFVGICFDATERKRAEESLLKMREELIKQNDELSALQQTLIEEKCALAEANARLAGLATIDGLTGIHNHRAFQQRMEAEWHMMTRTAKPLSLLLLDIDHFKRYNDSFGHQAGDEVLIQLGRVMKECARETDFIARYGGEEFVVILPQTDESGASVIAERLRASVEQAEWKSRLITVSIGVATASPLVPDSKELIALADRAMYMAKAHGRNCVCGGRSHNFSGSGLGSGRTKS